MKIRELLSAPSKWTRHKLARNRDGVPCPPDSIHACCWCISGAVLKCYESTQGSIVFEKISVYINAPGIAVWNDDRSRTFRDIQLMCIALDI